MERWKKKKKKMLLLLLFPLLQKETDRLMGWKELLLKEKEKK